MSGWPIAARSMRTFYVPLELTAEVVCAEIRAAVQDGPPLEVVGLWTEFELLIAYDWAVREHLWAESRNPDARFRVGTVRRRARPTFTSPRFDRV